MHFRSRHFGWFLGGCGLLWAGLAEGGVINQVGTYANWPAWPASWTVLSGLNDAHDSGVAEQIDFVGDTANPCGYTADNGSYLFFRMRVDQGTVGGTTFSDSHIIILDVVGQKFNTTTNKLEAGDDQYPDYGFAWDSKSTIVASHGLEMMKRNIVGTYWNGTDMADLDDDAGKKLSMDINGSGRTTDGYVRTDDLQNTTNFSTTTFVDFAVSWNYLNTYTDLRRGQAWRIAFGSIANSTDHNNLTGDIAGGVNPTGLLSSGWVEFQTAPEPSSLLLAAAGALSLLRRRPQMRRRG